MAATNPFGGNTISEKLAKNNYALWKAQVLASVRGARLEGHLTGTTAAPAITISVPGEKEGDKATRAVNPAYDEWVATDQQILGLLLSTLSRDVLAQVATCGTAAAAWSMLEEMYTSMTRARFINTRIALSNTKKGDLSITEYVAKMRALGDDMTAAGKVVDNEDLISYIIAGLDDTYEPVISSIVGKSEPMSFGEAFSQLLSFEQCNNLRHGGESSANLANRGCGTTGGNGGQRGRGGNNRGRGGNGGNNSANRGKGGRGNGGFNGGRQGGGVDTRPKCQLCYKRGHTVINCWYRYDEDFVPDEKYAGSAATSYGIDTNWYVDTGATDHVTGELEKLIVRDRYKGHDQVHTASGAGMEISHIGHSIVKTPSRDIHLRNILHVPKANKNLVSAQRLVSDNSAFMELYSKYFNLKDLATKKLLLRGPCRGRLYALPSTPPHAHSTKEVYGVSKPSFERWHSRLSHPSSPIVEKVISKNNLPCLVESNK